jgi:hypothetical protein
LGKNWMSSPAQTLGEGRGARGEGRAKTLGPSPKPPVPKEERWAKKGFHWELWEIWVNYLPCRGPNRSLLDWPAANQFLPKEVNLWLWVGPVPFQGIGSKEARRLGFSSLPYSPGEAAFFHLPLSFQILLSTIALVFQSPPPKEKRREPGRRCRICLLSPQVGERLGVRELRTFRGRNRVGYLLCLSPIQTPLPVVGINHPACPPCPGNAGSQEPQLGEDNRELIMEIRDPWPVIPVRQVQMETGRVLPPNQGVYSKSCPYPNRPRRSRTPGHFG